MYDELNERWHRMDALNAGLEEAVRSKAALEASVESAEALLVEAEYQKSFEKETRQMLLRVAKQRAETVGQMESLLTELSEKLKSWHQKLCKKYSEAIHQLKIGKKRMDERLKASGQKLKSLEDKGANTRDALANLLTPFGATKLDPYGELPPRDELVSKVFLLVAELEDECQSHASVKLLLAAEPVLTLLSKVKDHMLEDSVAAEATGQDPGQGVARGMTWMDLGRESDLCFRKIGK
eukprot:Skav235582  [mRNA]  locus=scaffold612:189225:192592:- [translate_table: standard]